MIGSIKRHCRLASQFQLVPAVLLAISVNVSPDPTRRATGYGGVLPVPSSPTPATPSRVDPLLAQQKRDTRAARGRVLYSGGRAPDTDRARSAAKVPCPDQRVAHARMPTVSPST